MFEINAFIAALEESLKNLDKTAAAEACMGFITFLRTSNNPPVGIKQAERILTTLRNARMFLEMEGVGKALTDVGTTSHKIWKLYAQAEIELSNFATAETILKQLVADTGTAPQYKVEYYEAHGLLGRVYKQLYVNAGDPSDPVNVQNLFESVKWYYDAYKIEPANIYQGINAVAMIERGRRDKINVDTLPNALALARNILEQVEDKQSDKKAETWDFATAAEACVALDDSVKALRWMSGYARMSDTDAFALASTLRQLDEVWQLNLKGETGKLLLPLLYGELLKRKEANLSLSAENLRQLKSSLTDIEKQYNDLKQEGSTYMLEKVFGNDSFESLSSLKKALARCMAVARIGRDAHNGLGTGFLLRGNSLHESLGDKFVLITNAHVTSGDPEQKCAVRPEKAVVTFEALDRAVEFKDLKQIWTSGSKKLDATILEFAPGDKERLKDLMQQLEDYILSQTLPSVSNPPTERIYVIGHPNGGGLQFSFADNLLLDHQPPLIHYHTPTDRGSSGSPVFNVDWELIGLHHAGSERKMLLNNKEGFYEANEGIWIQTIKNEFAKSRKQAAHNDNIQPER